jgi:hypothetical protein
MFDVRAAFYTIYFVLISVSIATVANAARAVFMYIYVIYITYNYIWCGEGSGALKSASQLHTLETQPFFVNKLASFFNLFARNL